MPVNPGLRVGGRPPPAVVGMAEAARKAMVQTMLRDVLEGGRLRVAVVGGSLGGLSAAAALEIEADCEVQVFERSPRMTGTEGAGLWVQPEFEHYMDQMAKTEARKLVGRG